MWSNRRLDLGIWTGWALIAVGVGCMYWPAGVVVAGVGVLIWCVFLGAEVARKNLEAKRE